MTEASHQMASNPRPRGQRKPGTFGRSAGSDIAIMDPAGALLAPDEVGEIVIRGPAVTRGSLADDDVNDVAFAHGWFHTGDEGVLDADGYLTISGRVKELINRGGEKISPREIDEVLLEHPNIEHAAAFAVPHRTLGEDVAAVVVPTGGGLDPDEVRSFVASRLAAHKVPQRVLVVDELPTGPTGKVQRVGLADRLGLTDELAPASALDSASPLEAAVAGVWANVLGVDAVGVDARFVEIGGDSLTSVAVVGHVADVFG